MSKPSNPAFGAKTNEEPVRRIPDLVRAVREQGFGRIKSERAVTAVFRILARLLAEGKPIEMGGLWLQVKPYRKQKRIFLRKPGQLKRGATGRQAPSAPRVLRTKQEFYLSQKVLLRFVDHDGRTHVEATISRGAYHALRNSLRGFPAVLEEEGDAAFLTHDETGNFDL